MATLHTLIHAGEVFLIVFIRHHINIISLVCRVGVDLSPVYINMVRAPLARLVSHYYFLRYGDDVLVDKVRARDGDTTTFDECVADQLSQDCDPKRMWLQVVQCTERDFKLNIFISLQIPFFCGTAAQCWEPGSEWALATAKRNLVNNYMVVGVTEQFDTFIEVRRYNERGDV